MCVTLYDIKDNEIIIAKEFTLNTKPFTQSSISLFNSHGMLPSSNEIKIRLNKNYIIWVEKWYKNQFSHSGSCTSYKKDIFYEKRSSEFFGCFITSYYVNINSIELDIVCDYFKIENRPKYQEYLRNIKIDNLLD